MHVWSWGAGTSGQLGTNLLQDLYFPARSVLPVASVVGLSCGGNHAAAVSGQCFGTWLRVLVIHSCPWLDF